MESFDSLLVHRLDEVILQSIVIELALVYQQVSDMHTNGVTRPEFDADKNAQTMVIPDYWIH